MSAVASAPDWVARSNEHAAVLLDVMAATAPETAGRYGVRSVDDQIVDLTPGFEERNLMSLRRAQHTFEERSAAEIDRRVREDLEILVNAAADGVRAIELSRRYELPYVDVAQLVFAGISALLDEQIEPERRPAALHRLQRYAGLEGDRPPLTALAMKWTSSRLADRSLLGPVRAQLERDLANLPTYLDGIAKLFAQYAIAGSEPAQAALRDQLDAYAAFVRNHVLPLGRDDFRLPAESYAFALHCSGIDAPPETLAKAAHAAFDAIQAEMQTLAPVVAREHGFAVTDYRDVIRALKTDQFVGEAILPAYRARLAEIEAIVRRERIVTLPDRDAQIRLATDAESAQTPAPHMLAPPIVGNTGERGTFVLPLRLTSSAAALDDFTYAAATWTLTAHEARPGHELQFSAMVERGVSLARSIFAFNSTNVEGWGLYSELLIEPFMPAAGRLVCLDYRLLRAARAFLDPELQLGAIAPDAARRILLDDVVLSEAMATSELQRYTFLIPGQAPSYFYGYAKMIELTAEVKCALGPRFIAQHYHDFVLAQGLLDPAQLRAAVLSEFVAAERGPA
ncbi:MAG: DUF885 domain-containing protein [Vulcanimicrobiaceae bacterium]